MKSQSYGNGSYKTLSWSRVRFPYKSVVYTSIHSKILITHFHVLGTCFTCCVYGNEQDKVPVPLPTLYMGVGWGWGRRIQ